MALQAVANINVDFYDKKYISINSKQLDKKTRFLSVTCYSHGELCPLNSGEHSAYIRYRKPDGYTVFNFCDINIKGKIIVELTEQMLAVAGTCYTDLVVVNKGCAVVDKNTGEITTINDSGILSTMPFYVSVSETSFENSIVESSYEYNGLNELLERAEADYEEVILTSKSWAIGNTGIRDGENTNNSMYYSKQSSNSANAANTSALNAANSEALADEHMHNALTYSQNSQTYMSNAKAYMESAKTSETNAKTSETNVKSSENNAKTSETNAKTSEGKALNSEQAASISEANAKLSENNAKTSEDNALLYMNSAKTSETNSMNSAIIAQSYAVGGTGTRTNEDKDNSHYYYELVRTVVDSLNSGFIPMGTISFSELATAEKATGFSYNISDDFVTDATFREGEGKFYTAGTNVYYTANGYWDCFGGAASPTATVDEVKEYLGIE